jgi:hypothetical protein
MALRGIKFHVEEALEYIVNASDGSLTLKTTKGVNDFFSHVMFSTSQVPNTKNLGLEEIGVKLNKNGAFYFGNFGQSQPTSSSGFGSVSTPDFWQSTFEQPTQQNIMVTTPKPIKNPFGTLPTMPHMFIGRSGGSRFIQYGIEISPINEKPNQERRTLMLTPRHVTQRSRIYMNSCR